MYRKIKCRYQFVESWMNWNSLAMSLDGFLILFGAEYTSRCPKSASELVHQIGQLYFLGCWDFDL